VGVGRHCITPEDPIWLYGYATAARFQPCTGVLDDLFIKALALEDYAGRQAVIVTFDLCVVRKPLADRIRAAVMAETALSRDRVLLNFSHTHSGPALYQPDLRDRFPVSDDQLQVIRDYTDALPAAAASVAAAAVADLAPGQLSVGCGDASAFIANRRSLTETGEWNGMRANPDGSTDSVVLVLRADNADGTPKAVVFGCACHNVTLGPQNLLVSADYAGFARQRLEAGQTGVEAFYIAGCGADTNTNPRSGPRQWVLVRQHGETLATEVQRVLSGYLEPVIGDLGTVWSEVDLPLQTSLTDEALERLAAGPEWQGLNAKALLALRAAGQDVPQNWSAPVSVWQLGKRLALAAISGEVPSSYAIQVRERLHDDGIVWTAGYSHEVFGYLPTVQILREGGYETRGLLPPAVGYFAPDVEETVLEEIVRLAAQMDVTHQQEG